MTSNAHPPPGSGRLHERSALQLAELLRAGEVSSRELTSHFLDRIDRHGGQVNAFVRLFERRARREAAAADRASKAGEEQGTFAGVPIAVKDTDPVQRSRFHVGSRVLKYAWSPTDSPATRRIRAGGFVITGKTVTSELALMPIVETDLGPPCRNPWDWQRTPGGSSGGAAAAVAGGLLPIAHATDGGGSIRIPASHCGLFGIKVSRGLLENFYGSRDPNGTAGVNAVTHTVEDSAAMLDVMAGTKYDPRTPPADSMLARSREEPPRLKIRFTTESHVTDVEPHIAEGVEQVAHALEGLGHDVSPSPIADLPVEDILPIFGRMAAGLPAVVERWLQPSTIWLRRYGLQFSDAEITDRIAMVRREIDRWFGDTDVWLTPTVPQRPSRVGYWHELDGEETFRSAIPYGAFTTVFNISGHPAANVPAGLSPDGLPFGAQIVGRRGSDATLLALARQLEQVRPWAHLRSPMMAT
mgnify:CR=1 FL=1